MRKLHTMMTKYKNLPVQVRASLWFLICSFLQKGVSMLTTPIFTRLLSTGEYGRYSVFNSWLGIISIFVSLNLSAGVYQQGLVKFDKEREGFSSSLQGLSLTLVIAWTGIYLIAHEFWNRLLDLTTVQMLALLCMIWTTATFGFWSAEQRVHYKYRMLVGITLAVSLAKPLLGVLLVIYSDDKVTARILGLVLVELIGYAGCFLVQMKRGRIFFSRKFWKYSLGFNLPLIPHYLSQVVLNNSDRIMINDMVGDDSAGVYSLAYSIAMIMTLFNVALMQTLSPWIYQKIKDKKIRDIASAAYFSLGLVAVVNLILIALAPEVVRVFAPSSYYEAVYCIPPVAMGCFFMYAYDLFAKFAFYYEKTILIMVASVGGALLNIGLNYIGINRFGYVAAAYTTLICYLLYDVFHYILMMHICDKYLEGVKPYHLRILLGIGGVFLLCGFVIMFTYDCAIARYAIIIEGGVGMIVNRKKIGEVIRMLVQKKCK